MISTQNDWYEVWWKPADENEDAEAVIDGCYSIETAKMEIEKLNRYLSAIPVDEQEEGAYCIVHVWANYEEVNVHAQ